MQSIKEITCRGLFLSPTLFSFLFTLWYRIYSISLGNDGIIFIFVSFQGSWIQLLTASISGSINNYFDMTQKSNHIRCPLLFIVCSDKNQFPYMICIAQGMQDIEFKVGWPSVMNNSTSISCLLQSRQNHAQDENNKSVPQVCSHKRLPPI